MSDPYIGEIRPVGFSFAPVNWALCNGQLIAIAENEALFSLIGTTYGGDGTNTFGLPNLQSRVPVHMSPSYPLGETLGTENVTLNGTQIPLHSHSLVIQPALGNLTTPTNNYLAGSSDGQYAVSGPLATGPVQLVGQNIPHENRQPFLTINYIISLYGIYPSRN